jgi:hypothetical protein
MSSTEKKLGVPLSQFETVQRIAISAVKSAVERNREWLMKLANVLDVRTGFKFRGGWITDEPAIVVTVQRKVPKKQLDAKDVIPEIIDGLPVDVAPADPSQQLRASLPQTEARGVVAALPEEEPLILPGVEPEEGERGVARGGAHGYQKPAKLQLKPVRDAMTVTCHASPDAGWPTLHKFLQGTKQKLTVAMYDFTAPHILKAIEEALDDGDKKLNLCMDPNAHGSRRKGEMLKPEVVEGLESDLGKRFDYAKAAVGILYPNAYHIKVAVRDAKAFWLSSGNWQNSNQPPEDVAKLDVSAQRKLFSSHNREWHVIVEHPGLAKIYEDYIQFDMREAKRVETEEERGPRPPAVELPDLLVSEEMFEPAERAAVQIRLFRPQSLNFTAQAPLRIQPLLTPDNYHENVRKLIESAKEKVYLQNQYIKPRTDSPQAFRELYEALAQKMADGLDVRIILRREGNVRRMIESLKTVGIRTDGEHLRLLAGCHNKGIIVDTQTVMVGSHNWSGDGAVFNRDASLILYDAKAAAYFEKIFLYDWDNRAHPSVPTERGAVAMLATAAAGARGVAAPRGMKRVSWQEFFGE